MSEEKITLTRRVDQPSTSLAVMLKNQYVSKEFHDIFAATELREHEIIGTAGVMGSRFITLIMSTEEEDLEGLEGEQLKMMQERLAIKKRILRSTNAMAFAIHDTFLYAFGLLRISLKRQSRKEAMTIATSPRPVTPAQGVSTKDKLLSKLGISKKYRQEYVEKE